MTVQYLVQNGGSAFLTWQDKGGAPVKWAGGLTVGHPWGPHRASALPDGVFVQRQELNCDDQQRGRLGAVGEEVGTGQTGGERN